MKTDYGTTYGQSDGESEGHGSEAWWELVEGNTFTAHGPIRLK